MGFTLGADNAGRSEIHLEGEPDYVVPLQIAPTSLEDEMEKGKWLVVSMSVWSMHDIQAGHRAIEVIRQRGGLVKLGLRPFNDPRENMAWIPGSRFRSSAEQLHVSVSDRDGFRQVTLQGNVDASPIWILLSEGEVVGVRHGRLSAIEIDEFVSELLPDNPA